MLLCCVPVFIIAASVNRAVASNNQEHPERQTLGFSSGKLTYIPDSLGNRVPEFSYCGYRAANVPIPDVPVHMVVPVKKGDATARIQAALDYVAALPADKDGIRGAVLLLPGVYEVAGQLNMRASGVVLRGSGFGNNGTVVKGTGKDRQTLIQITGKADKQLNAEIKITDRYVPVNRNIVHIANANAFKAGDKVMIRRPSTANWINALHADHFGGGITALGWKPGQRDIYWDRTVVSANNGAIELDVPLTTALDEQYGGGTITTYTWPGRISDAGVENLRCISDYNTANPKDEEHRWMAITISNAQDAWVRQVVFEHFAGSAVYVLATGKRITVEDCKSLQPISEIGGQRRNTFLTEGQQTLFQRIYSEYGFHDFATGFCAAGPNAFVQCEAYRSYSFSGAIDSWSSGILFDCIRMDGQAISFMNRGQDGNGAGWCAANSIFWNCNAARIDCYQPPTAQNYAYGSWAQFAGDGYWEGSNNTLQPYSLYYKQLGDRLNQDLTSRAQLLEIKSNATSSPTVQQAAELTALALRPAPTMNEFIDEAIKRQPIPITANGVKSVDELTIKSTRPVSPAPAMHIENGWLLRGQSLLTGNRIDVPWWSGSSRPYALSKSKPAITRFVPGQTGTGLTDDLHDVIDSMLANHQVALEQHYALWYDRRRDDHERVRRTDGDVWPPFYEVPFARSGKDTAWDGLSKYDLTKYNYWYWNRLQQFATLADEKGLVLVHQQYFQHNIIEAGAHYADFTWRPANNINNTGFPEPPPYAGDKRIFMAEQFYDVTHPVRRALHRAYIRKCLDNFTTNNGVIQLIGDEFTGPLHFVQFWLDVIKEWEGETGKKVIVGLSTTKDVQDSILADPARAAVVDLIDIRYWHYQADDNSYAPIGGQNLAPRQHARLLKPKPASVESVYRAVKEYHDKFPGKAVMYSGDNYDNAAWGAFMAGGSLAAIPMADAAFFTSAATMQPTAPFVLSNNRKECIIYSATGEGMQADLTDVSGTYKITWIDATSNSVLGTSTIKAGKQISLNSPKQGRVVCWIRK
jgi:hypothetical protein